MENGKQMAFPGQLVNGEVHIGLTKREYFAALAMQGLLANSDIVVSIEEITKESVRYADSLLKTLESK
jgi:hypothetical protein